MLEKCPLLEILTLDINTNTGHSRMLTRVELFERPTPTTLDAENNNNEGEDQAVEEEANRKRIVAHGLHILTLIGGWSISNESGFSLREVLAETFPNSKYFEAHYWTTGITTVEDVVETVRSIPLANLKIRKMSLRLDLSRDEEMKRVEELGWCILEMIFMTLVVRVWAMVRGVHCYQWRFITGILSIAS